MAPAKNETAEAAAVRHVSGWILALTAAGTAVAAWRWGGMAALSVLLGGVLGWFGYRTHVQVVDRALARRKSRHTLVRALLRYGLIALALYGMMRLSFFDIQGFLIGLLLPAAAVLIEGVVYVIRNLRG